MTTGFKIAKATVSHLIEWKCADNVRAMVFDTTRSNTGSLTAACVSVQDKLGRELLWMPCRHHIGEVILTWSWNAFKFELSTSPEINLFGRFKANFYKLNYKKGDCLFIPQHSDFVKSERDSIVFLCENALEQGFARGDYRELIMLSLVFLNACSYDVIMIQKPGACHKARWMAKLIYSLKMILLSKQINKVGSNTIFRKGLP